MFDERFSAVATNVEDMLGFHADNWSKMFGTSTLDTQPENKMKESTQKPTQLVKWDIKDSTIEKEKALQQPMLKPNPLTEPNCLMTRPVETNSQAASEQVKHQSKSPSQEQRCSRKVNLPPSIMRDENNSALSPEPQSNFESRNGLLSSVKNTRGVGFTFPAMLVRV